MTKGLDVKDWKILSLLCENARYSHNQIARKVGLGKNTVSYRIQRLEKMGVICGYFTILNHELLGLNFYEVLVRTTGGADKEKSLIDFLINHPNVMVVNGVSGEWDLVFEIGSATIQELFKVIGDIKNNNFDAIDSFEVHPILGSYKVEQLPIELIKEKELKPFKKVESIIEVDHKDKLILYELDKDSRIQFHEIAKRVGLTAETVSSRIKKLKKKEVIIKFTAKVDLDKLDYDIYLITVDVRNLSQKTESGLRSYLINHLNVRYAFMSGARPCIMVYFAVKDADVLDLFLKQIKGLFPDTVVNQRYLLEREQYKYDLFPIGFTGD